MTATPEVKVYVDWYGQGSPAYSPTAAGLACTDADAIKIAANQYLGGDLNFDAPITMRRGKEQLRPFQPPAVGTAKLLLRNLGGRYSNAATGLTKGKRVTLQSTASDSSVLQSLWSGEIDTVTQDPSIGVQSASVTLRGPMARLQESTIALYTPVYEFIRIDQAIQIVLVAANIPFSAFTLQTSSVALRWFWLSGQNPWAVLQQLVATEGPGGRLFEAANGTIVFHSRATASVDVTSVTDTRIMFYGESGHTGSGGQIAIPYTAISYDDGVKDLVNYAEVPIQNYAWDGAPSTIWSYAAGVLVVSAYGSVTLTADLSSPACELAFNYTIQLGSFKVDSNGFTVYPALSASSGSRINITVYGGSSGVQLVGVGLTGRTLVSTTANVMVSNANTTLSKQRFGVRSYSVGTWPAISSADGQVLADWAATAFATGRPTVSVTVLVPLGYQPSSLDWYGRLLSAELGDRVSINEKNIPLASDFTIEAIDVSLEGPKLRITFHCERVVGFAGSTFAGSTFIAAGIGPWVGAATDDAAIGTNAWTAAAAAGGVADNSYASNATAGTTHGLRTLLNGSSGIAKRVDPKGVIDGVVVRVRGHASGNITAATSGYAADADENTGHPILGAGPRWTTPEAAGGGAPAVLNDGANYTSGAASVIPWRFNSTVPLRMTNFGITLAAGAVPVGITVRLYTWQDASYYDPITNFWLGIPTVFLAHVQLVKPLNGEAVPVGSNFGSEEGVVNGVANVLKFIPATSITGAPPSVLLGDPERDVFLAGLTKADVENSLFGVEVSLGTFNLFNNRGAYIAGAAITIYYRGATSDSRVSLVTSNVIGTVNRASNQYIGPDDAYYYYGDPQDTWDGGLTPAIVNAPDFGAELQYAVTSGSAINIDEIAIYVYWHYPEADFGGSYRGAVLSGTYDDGVRGAVGTPPIVYLRMGESAGSTTANDERGLLNGTIAGEVEKGIFGLVDDANTCFRFDGVSGYIALGDSLDSQLAGSFTIEILCKLDTITGTFTLFDKRDALGAGVDFIVVNGVPTLRRGAVSATGPAITERAAYHLVGKYNGATMTVYTNGVAGTAQADVNAVAGNATNANVGRSSLAGTYVKGLLDEFAFYDFAMGESSVITHVLAGGLFERYGANVHIDQPASLWSMTTAGPTMTDSIGGINGTASTDDGAYPLLYGQEAAVPSLGASWYCSGMGKVSLGDNYDLTGSFTIEMLVKLTSTQRQRILFYKDVPTIVSAGTGQNQLNAGTAGVVMRLDMPTEGANLAGTQSFLMGKRNGISARNPNPLVAGQWYHVALTYNSVTTEMISYVNGLPSPVVLDAGTITNNAQNAYLPIYLDGYFDEAAIWTSALDPSVILIHAHNAGVI